jgi:hypothetical protein
MPKDHRIYRIPEAEYLRRLAPVLEDKSLYTVLITLKDVTLLISAIQLALRHPNYPRSVKQHVTDVTLQLIAYIDDVHPGTGELLLQGFDPRFDD